MFIANIRLIFPNFRKFSLSRKSYILWKLFEASYFHWFRLFNTTLVPIKQQLADIRALRDLPAMEAIRDDVGDVFVLGFQPPFLLENVTTLGSIESIHECYLFSFPRMEAKTVSIDGLKFIWYNSDYSIMIAMSTIFFAIVCISILAKEFKGSFFEIFWYLHWTTLAHQVRIRASRGMIKMTWLSLLMTFVLIESITIACMNTEHVSENKFDKIEKFDDVVRKNLRPVMEDWSGCTQMITSEPEYVQNYLQKNRYPQNTHKFSAVDSIFIPTFRKFSLTKMALLIDVERWIQIKRTTCSTYPQILLENPSYRSRKPLQHHIKSLAANKRLDKKIRNALNRESSTLLEASLYGRKGWLAYRRRENEIVDSACMREVLKEKVTKHSPLGFSFIQSAFLTWTFALITAWIIFMIEILIQKSLDRKQLQMENFKIFQRLIENETFINLSGHNQAR